MRRPTSRQTKRRTSSGDPREICNHHDPGPGAGVSHFLGATAISAQAGVAGLRTSLTHLGVRSLASSAGAFAWTVWRSRPIPGVA